MAALRVAIFGISGRMGASLLRAAAEDAEVCVSGALAAAGSDRLGQSLAAGGHPVVITSDPTQALRNAAVAVDFSTAAALTGHARACAAARVPLLVGTTGFDAAAKAALSLAAAQIPVLVAPNTSVGMSVLTGLAAAAAAALGVSYDVQISEAHHRAKRDAPSGSAIALGEAVAAGRSQEFAAVAVVGAAHAGPRKPGSIGFSFLRAGDIVGEHTVTFAADGERLELTHRATDRMIFARGALRAAAWLAARPPGLYGMQDVLALSEPPAR